MRSSTRASSSPIRAAESRPAWSTSSWLSGSPVSPAARLVTSEMPEDLRAGLAGGDGFEHGRHADQVAAEHADHVDLGRGLVVRAGELDVDALFEGRVDLLAQRAQPRRVQVGQVDEVGADDRRGGRQVEVVADQHRLAGAHALAQTAAAVGQHDGLAAGGDGGAHAVRRRRRRRGPRRSGCGRGRPARACRRSCTSGSCRRVPRRPAAGSRAARSRGTRPRGRRGRRRPAPSRSPSPGRRRGSRRR